MNSKGTKRFHFSLNMIYTVFISQVTNDEKRDNNKVRACKKGLGQDKVCVSEDKKSNGGITDHD